jgi:hypothetical protein
MKRSNDKRGAIPSVITLAFAVVLGTVFAGAQTTPAKKPVVPPPPPKIVKPVVAAKPAAAAPVSAVKSATPVPATKSAAPVAAPVVKTQTTTPTSAPVPATSTSGQIQNYTNQIQSYPGQVQSYATQMQSTASSVGSNLLPTTNSSGTPAVGGPSNTNPGGATYGHDPRTPVAGQGVGTFLGAGWTLTAYGCFRTDVRLFCDFDVVYRNNIQANSNIWYTVNLVDDGGKITGRHNAFFVGDDGSQFNDAYVGQNPVRFIMEYDNVNPRYTSITLVNGSDRMQGVPITPMDPNTPAGTIPARASVGTPAAATSTSASAGAQNAANTATNTVTNSTNQANQVMNTVNDQKSKAQGFWNSLKGAAQPH